MNANGKFHVQDAMYEFPYHYLVQVDEREALRLHRHLAWGLDYMTYMTFVADLIRQRRPESLLDIGCGDGRLLHMIGFDVPHTCGIDLSERAIAHARAFNPTGEFICGDIAAHDRRYKCVTAIEVLEHIPDVDLPHFIEVIARLVEDDGRLLISVPTMNIPLNKKHYRHYDIELLRATIDRFFEIENHWWLYRQGMLERCIRSSLCNRVYVLNFSPLLGAIWRLHKRTTYHACPANAAHLVCIAKLRQR